ncbi:hypothetical protein [Stenotrophomonas sp. DR009]|uniref:hypothetical protein n=1 Tax=Stenotrophomonas sp. DR009 TaxID=3398461 RepID=UPI003BB02ACB
MDKTFEVEVVRLNGGIAHQVHVQIGRERGFVVLSVQSDCGSIRNSLELLPSEAVTIGEQLIAAGKAGEV